MKFWPMNPYERIAPDYLDPDWQVINNKGFREGINALENQLVIDKFTSESSCHLYNKLHSYANFKLRETGFSVDTFVVHGYKNPNERQEFISYTSIPVRNIEKLFRIAHPPALTHRKIESQTEAVHPRAARKGFGWRHYVDKVPSNKV